MSAGPPSTPPIRDHNIEANLLETFDRFYSVASFYPHDHSLCQTALTDFYKALDQAVPSGESLVVEPDGDGVRLQGVFLGEDSVGSQHFSTLLEALGIARLKINSKAPLIELHSMVTTLNSLKLEAGSILQFHSLDFQALPTSVEITQRKFGWRQLQLGLDNAMSEKLLQQMNQLMDIIQEQPWSDARKEEFRLQTESFMVKTIERMDTSLVRSIQSQRNLEDVLLLGASVVENAIASLDGKQDARSINQIFNQAAESLAYGNDNDSLKLMFEVLQEGAQDQTADLNIPQPDETKYSQSISDLTTQVMQIAAKASEPDIASADHCQEMLAVSLKMLSDGVSVKQRVSLKKKMASHLALPIGQGKIDTIHHAITDLVKSGNRTAADHILPMTMPYLMRNNSEGFAQFLSQVGPVKHPEKLAILWPHLVALMLLEKPPQNKTMIEYLNQAIAELPLGMVQEEAHRLDFLPAVQTGKFGGAILGWPLAQSHGVLAALLAGRQSKQIGQRLNRQWLDKAPNKLAGVLMRVLGPYKSKHLQNYLSILDFSSTGILAPESRQEISRLIQNCLKSLDEDARKANWVPHAINELGLLDFNRNQEFLHEVLNRKRMIVLHAWPFDARQMAENAIQKNSKGKKGGQR